MGRPGGRKEISSKCRKTGPEQLLDRDEQCVGAFKAALYAVGELNKTELKEKAQETYEWELVSLLSGTRQVVAGIKYTLKLKVARSTSCHVSDKGPRYGHSCQRRTPLFSLHLRPMRESTTSQ